MKQPRPEDFGLTQETIDEHNKRVRPYAGRWWRLPLPLVPLALVLLCPAKALPIVLPGVIIAAIIIPRIRAHWRRHAPTDPVVEKIRRYNRALEVYAAESEHEETEGPEPMAELRRRARPRDESEV
jgi:hypothetical protein